VSSGNTSWHLLSRAQFNSTFNSKCSTSAKATAALCVSVEQLNFLPVKPNSFSCICGEVVLKSQRATDKLVAERYEQYFVCKVGNEDEVWVSTICCTSCSRALVHDGKREALSIICQSLDTVYRDLLHEWTLNTVIKVNIVFY
jgi:hypothetical protein